MKHMLKELEKLSVNAHNIQLEYSFGSEQYEEALKQEIELNSIKVKLMDVYGDILEFKATHKIN